jgi:SNF family Na+-dependent transporter
MERAAEGKRENWGSRVGIIFAVMGSAIGIGNFVRFPGIAAKYEGGTFMIPYFTALILLGLPIAWVEWSIGRYGGQRGFSSSPGIFRAIWPHRSSPYFGVLGLIIPIGIYMYYIWIESWCLYYAYAYLDGSLLLGRDPALYEGFFASFTGQAGDGLLIENGSTALLFFLFCFVLNFVVIYRGLSKGIEILCKYAIPLLFVIGFVMLARVLTLGTPDPSMPERNVLNGLGYMWNPHTSNRTMLESLANARMWLEAAGQIFFSLSVGFGIIITYASYLRKSDDIAMSSLASASGNEFAEVALGGLILIPAAFIFLGPEGTGGSTFRLGFITMPVVFEYMTMGRLFGFLWYALLFLAAFTSSLSMLQPAIAFLEEGLGLGRRASVTILGFISLTGSAFILYFSKGLKALDTIDFWIGSFSIYVLATFEVILAGWIFGADRIIEETRRGALIRIPNFIKFIIKYVSPVYLLTVFFFWGYQNIPAYIASFRKDPVARLSLVFILLMTLFFILLIHAAVKRWRGIEARR